MTLRSSILVSFQQFQTAFKLSNFTNLKSLFSVLPTNFPKLSMAKVEKTREKFYINGNFPFLSVVALFLTVPTHSEKGLKPFTYNYMLSILLKLPMPRPLWRPLLVNSVMSMDWLCRRERSTFRQGTQSNNALQAFR